MKFIKPKVMYNDGFDNLKNYEDLVKVKIYKRGGFNIPDIYKTDDKLISKFEELEKYVQSHRDDTVGKLYSAANKYIRDVKLYECVSFKFGSDFYIDTTTYDRPSKVRRNYDVYNGFRFKLKDNHVYSWFSREEVSMFNAPVPQQLDDKGHVNLAKDMKTSAIVNYGTDLIQQEMKDIYCSTNGRFIKYQGKNYYVKEAE